MSWGLALALAAAQPAAPDDCQAALGLLWEEPEETSHAHRVDGAAIASVAALAALRKARPDGPLMVRGGDFSGGDFRKAGLGRVCFLGTNLAGSDWRGAEAPGAAFVRADLTRARLAGARLTRLLLRDAVLQDVDAAGADLSGGRLDGGWFRGSVEGLRLDGATLVGFRFDCGLTIDDGCPVDQGGAPMRLRGADLTGANLFRFADLAEARIDRTEVNPDQLGLLRDARLAGPLRLVGGEAEVVLSPDEARRLIGALEQRDGEALDAEPSAPLAPPAWLRPGEVALFVDAPLSFADRFRRDPLFAKVLPVLIGASSTRLLVRAHADGSIDARGFAIAANAHSCTLHGDGLRLDPASGWYSGPHEAWEEDPPEWRDRPMPVLRLEGERARVYQLGKAQYGASEGDPRVSVYAGCGMRAALYETVRVPVAPEEARRLWAEMEEPPG